MIDAAMLRNWFGTSKTLPDEEDRKKKISAAALIFATVVVDNTPACPDQTVSVRHIRDAVMIAHDSIACKGN